MTVLQPTTTTAVPRRSLRRGVLEVVICSLLVTSAAAVVATLVAVPASDLAWSVAFVVTRWVCVAVLLVLPLVNQLVVRTGRSWALPWALRTPATALLLTIESIGFDILSAQL